MYKLPYTGAEIESLLKGISNKNLLHNWDFRKPVNQRGQSSYSGAVYGIDRWKGTNVNHILTVQSGYISLSGVSGANVWLQQYLENASLFYGKLLTVSVLLLDGTLLTATGTLPQEPVGSNTGFASTQINGANVGCYKRTDGTVFVQLSQTAGVSSDFVAVKLELGSVSTLANDPPADYGEQLALCQRYCLGILPFMFVRASSYTSSYIDFHIPVPVSMRTTPLIIVNGIALYNMAGTSQSGFTFSIPVHTGNGVLLRATKSAHGLTDAYIGTGSITVFSADI